MYYFFLWEQEKELLEYQEMGAISQLTFYINFYIDYIVFFVIFL